MGLHTEGTSAMSRRFWVLRWVLTRLPILRGFERIPLLDYVRKAFPQQDRQFLARLRNGLKIQVSTQDVNGRMLSLFGSSDPRVVGICRALLRKGDDFLDIGANYGAVGLLCHDAVSPGGMVHLFEPQPALCRAMRDCATSAQLTNVRVHELGLMDRDGELELAQNPGHSGSASFVTKPAAGRRIVARVADVAHYVPPLLRGRAFGAKLDVEGAEERLLPWLVAQPTLRFVLFESLHLGDRVAVWELLHAAGLAAYGVRRSLFIIQLERLTRATQLGDHVDVLAFRARCADELLDRARPTTLARLI